MAPVIALVDDLYFMSIINAAARAHGIRIRFLRPGEAVPTATRLVLIDLDSSGRWQEQIAEYLAAGGRAIAFGPHLDTEKRKQAKAAGCNRVLAKSKFVQELGAILSSVRTAPVPRDSAAPGSRQL